MKKNAILLLSIAILILASCKKKKVPAQILKTYLSKEIVAQVGTFTWNYDAQNKCTGYKFTSDNEAINASFDYIVQSYDANNRFTEILLNYVDPGRPDYRIRNTYNANGLLDGSTYTNLSSNAVESVLTKTISGNQTTITTKNGAGVTQSSQVYTATPDGRNNAEIKGFNSAGTLTITNVYSGFTDKKSLTPLYPIGYSMTPTFENTFSTITSTRASTGAVTINSYTYEYDAEGYPTKRTNTTTGDINTYEVIKR